MSDSCSLVAMRASLVVAAALTLVACHSGNAHMPDGPAGDDDAAVDTQQGDFTIAVDQTSVSSTFGGSAVATVTVTRDMLDGDIALSARDLPAGVTVTFQPATLSPGTDSSVATVAVTAGAPVGASTLTLVGTAGSLEHTTTLGLTVLTMTVNGTVAGIGSGLTVGLVGKTSTTTGAGGTFSFTDVTPPYDLYPVTTILGTKYVTYYKGLTRSDPIVTAPRGATSTFISAGTIQGTMTGRTTALNAYVGWSDFGSEPPGDDTYSFSASWPFSATRTGTLYAIEWTAGPDNIKYGSTNATVTANTTNTVDITVAALATIGILNGSFSKPAAGTFGEPNYTISQQLGSQAINWQQNFGSGVVDCKIPIIPAGKTTVVAWSDNGAGTINDGFEETYYVRPELAATTDISFTLQQPATLMAPADGASAITTATDFTFSGPANTVYGVTISTGGTTKVSYTVYTTSTTVRIPAIAEAELPAAQAFKWQVAGYGPHASVDDIATAIGPEVATDGILPTHQPDVVGPAYTYTTSAKRNFTSQ